jgi:threonylcarbamoyladenosine tRNA methylthiotransferase MtaB
MKFKIITLGCKVNTYESEMMKEKLLQAGYQETFDNDANIVIINTCSVTNMADSKSRKLIRFAKKENKQSIIVVCGCSAENHQEELKNLDIDILIGNKDKSRIVELISEYLKNSQKIVKFYDRFHLTFEDMTVNKFSSHTRAFMKIQDGCNNFCAYCIIPYLRGNIRSKDINAAYEEAKELVSNGHQEIVLTGIHTGSYGRGCGFDLVDLLEKMAPIPNLKRIRLSSIEITELNDKFFTFLKNNSKLCNHLHVPLQAGSDHVLKLMGRKYTLAEYADMIDKIRTIRPDINISTDIIVGFPQETTEDFNSTLAFAKKIKYAKIHVFPYSKRDGTKAAVMPNQIDGNIKKQRAESLINLSNELEYNYNNLFKDKTLEVLIEENINNTSIGHTSNYLRVIIDKTIPRNTFVNVKITDIFSDHVKGKLQDV